MGQFKPMVKMMTTEPSVILKLKKGGKVASKMDGGYMPMQSTMPAQAMPARGGLAAAPSPMAPSMAARRRAMMAKPAVRPAMNPTMMKKGGKADDMGQDKAMIKKAFKQHDAQEHMVGSTKLKLKHGGMMDGGGMHMMPDGKMMKNSAMKHGGKFATGGVVNGQGGFANGGIIKSVKGSTKMSTAKPDHSPANTGGVKLGNGGGYATGGVAKANGGGYKMGGTAKKAYATGGTVDSGKPVAMPQGAKKPTPPVSTNRVSGTFKKGGKVTPAEGNLMKAFGAENKTAMKQAKAQSNDVYSKYQKMQKGGSPTPNESFFDKNKVDPKSASDKASRELEEAMNPLSMVKELAGKAKNYFMPKADSVTKTKESVTVTPAGKKRGGRAC